RNVRRKHSLPFWIGIGIAPLAVVHGQISVMSTPASDHSSFGPAVDYVCKALDLKKNAASISVPLNAGANCRASCVDANICKFQTFSAAPRNHHRRAAGTGDKKIPILTKYEERSEDPSDRTHLNMQPDIVVQKLPAVQIMCQSLLSIDPHSIARAA